MFEFILIYIYIYIHTGSGKSTKVASGGGGSCLDITETLTVFNALINDTTHNIHDVRF